VDQDELLIHLIVAIIGGVVGVIIAVSKGRNPVGWFFLCFFFPLIGIIIVAVLPNLKRERERQEQVAVENRRLREQLRQERIKHEAFRAFTSARLDTHDQALGMDTRQALPGGVPVRQLGMPDNCPRLWYYEVNGQSRGPLSESALQDLLRSGRIDVTTLVWCEDLGDWTPLGEAAPLLRGGAP